MKGTTDGRRVPIRPTLICVAPVTRDVLHDAIPAADETVEDITSIRGSAPDFLDQSRQSPGAAARRPEGLVRGWRKAQKRSIDQNALAQTATI
jgi:hypothetical protein